MATSSTDSQRLVSADRLTGLGRLADNVVLATIHITHGKRSTEDDVALVEAIGWLDKTAGVLADPLDLQRSLRHTESLDLMGQFVQAESSPLRALTGTLRNGGHPNEETRAGVAATLQRLRSKVEALKANTGTDDDLRDVQGSFASLAQVALSLNEEILENSHGSPWTKISSF